MVVSCLKETPVSVRIGCPTSSLLIVALSLPAGSAYASRIAARLVASIGDENAVALSPHSGNSAANDQFASYFSVFFLRKLWCHI